MLFLTLYYLALVIMFYRYNNLGECSWKYKREKHIHFFQFYCFKPWILTEDLELTCAVFLFSSSNYFVAGDLFWTKGSSLHVREPVMLDHKIWWATQKEALSLG